MAGMARTAHSADDKRALFVRVVDDIVDQIRTGKLAPEDKLPTARKMAELYDVASMTAQRALRELQAMGLTYGVVGKAAKAAEWLESLPLHDKAKTEQLQAELAQIHAELTLLQAIIEGDQDVSPDSPLGPSPLILDT